MQLVKIYTDAAYNPKTKAAGLGMVYELDGNRYKLKAYQTDVFDNHQAEFLAFKEALVYFNKNLGEPSNYMLWLQSDSQILINSLDRQFAKKEEYNKVLQEILELVEPYQDLFPKWISETNNKGADMLAKQALQENKKLTSQYKLID